MADVTNNSGVLYLNANVGGHYYHLGPAPEGVNATDLTRFSFNDSQFGGVFGGVGLAYRNGAFLISLDGQYNWSADNNIDYYDAPQKSTVPGGGTIDLSQYPDSSHLRGFGASLTLQGYASERLRIGGIVSVLVPDASSNTPLKGLSGSQYLSGVAGIGPRVEYDVVKSGGSALALVLDGQFGPLRDDSGELYWNAWRVGAGLTFRGAVAGGQNYWVDSDGDTYGAKGSPPKNVFGGIPPEGWVTNDGDCDDSEIRFAENCDTKTYYQDKDGDGWGNTRVTLIDLSPPRGYVEKPGDCDDDNPAAYPGADEIPNDGVDNDCRDGDLKTSKWYRDADGDQYGNPDESIDVIDGETPNGQYVQDNTDCDDTNPAANPGALEIPDNGVDEDCDGEDQITPQINVTGTNFWKDEDGDTYGSDKIGPKIFLNAAAANTEGYTVVQGGDCNDADPAVFEGCSTVNVQVQNVQTILAAFAQDIQFGNDSVILTAGSTRRLDELAKYLTENPGINGLEIGGHTSSVGNDAYNMDLSLRRADAVVNYLVNTGKIDSSRLKAAGYGETVPDDKDDGTKESPTSARNRRVEIRVMQ